MLKVRAFYKKIFFKFSQLWSTTKITTANENHFFEHTLNIMAVTKVHVETVLIQYQSGFEIFAPLIIKQSNHKMYIVSTYISANRQLECPKISNAQRAFICLCVYIQFKTIVCIENGKVKLLKSNKTVFIYSIIFLSWFCFHSRNRSLEFITNVSSSESTASAIYFQCLYFI